MITTVASNCQRTKSITSLSKFDLSIARREQTKTLNSCISYQKQATSDKEQRPNSLYLMNQQVLETFLYVTDFLRTFFITQILYVALWDRL